jgi:hypothetical protein
MPLREVFSIVKIFTGQAQRRKFFTCKLAVKLKHFCFNFRACLGVPFASNIPSSTYMCFC